LASEPEPEYLELEDLLELAALLLGDHPPVKDVGLLGAAASRPRITVAGEDAYPDIWAKAAALLQSIVKSHPLVDGNKRLGWLAAAVFLELNGYEVTKAPNDAVYELVLNVTAGRQSVDEIAAGLRGMSAAL
jgi:death on curing protein